MQNRGLNGLKDYADLICETIAWEELYSDLVTNASCKIIFFPSSLFRIKGEYLEVAVQLLLNGFSFIVIIINSVRF